jgi:hypothetical protein
MFKSPSWKIISRYIMATATYGAVRAVPAVQNGKKHYYNEEISKMQKKDMLVIEKMAFVIDQGRCSVIIWPRLLFEDFRSLELILTGKNPRHYVPSIIDRD